MKLENNEIIDIFDKLMSLPVLRIFKPFYVKYKEVLLYLFFGGLTTLLNLAVFSLFVYLLHMNALAANIIAWIAGVIFAYVTNRTWVFQQKDKKSVFREAFEFTTGRLVTLGLEELILWIGIDLMGGNELLVKIIGQIVVIVGNYIFSKFIVFKKKK